jgi:hypothetical protein
MFFIIVVFVAIDEEDEEEEPSSDSSTSDDERRMFGRGQGCSDCSVLPAGVDEELLLLLSTSLSGDF